VGPLAAGFAAWGVLGAGMACSRQEPPQLSAVVPVRATPKPQPSEGFGEAEMAGRMATMAVPAKAKGAPRIDPKLKSAIAEELQPALAALRRSLGQPFAFAYTPPAGFHLSESQKGWAWLMKVQRWELDQAIQDEDWSVAAVRAGEAIRFGARLTGGDASDAMMGVTTCRWAMDMIVPHLKQLSPAGLAVLADQSLKALKEMAPIEDTLANQLDTSIVTLQKIQEAYQMKGGEGVEELMGREGENPGEYLDDKPKEAQMFFASLRDELIQLHSWHVAKASNPVALQPEGNPFNRYDSMWLLPGEKKKYKTRPWFRLSRLLMTGHKALAEELPFLQARLKLLGITTRAEMALAQRGQAPDRLGAYPVELRTDPFTGEPMGYAAAGVQYKAWGAGVDGINDGGLTDLGPTTRDMSVRSSSPR
jgi:hypothetical protein